MSESANLTLTANAAKHINKIIAGNAEKATAVRLEVLGGGCSGYQYKFGFDHQFDATEDKIIERDGAKLIVDSTSFDMLRGSEVDYSESLMEAGFQVRNPNAKSSCGCGSSFAV